MPKKGHIPFKKATQTYLLRDIPLEEYRALQFAAASVGWSLNSYLNAVVAKHVRSERPDSLWSSFAARQQTNRTKSTKSTKSTKKGSRKKS